MKIETKPAFTGSQMMSLKRKRTDVELAGWHSSQLTFMLTSIIDPRMRFSFLAYYLRGLRPEVLNELKDPKCYIGPEQPLGKLVIEAITLIQEN